MIDGSEYDIEDLEKMERNERKFKKQSLHLRSSYWTKNDEELKNVGPKEKLISNFTFIEPSEEHLLV